MDSPLAQYCGRGGREGREGEREETLLFNPGTFAPN